MPLLPDAQAAGLANLLGLLPALSPVPTASTSDASSSSNPQPQYPTNHLRALLQPFLFPSPSMRGGSEEFSLVDEDDDDDEDEIKGMQVEADMVEKLGQTMEKNRDIKWAVYREVSCVLLPAASTAVDQELTRSAHHLHLLYSAATSSVLS